MFLLFNTNIMEISNYIITTTNDGRVLLYSALSTALIVLPREEYDKIFVNKDFANYEHLDFLMQLGFLVEDKEKQLRLLDRLAETENTRRDPDIKIFSTNRCNARCYYCFEEGIKFVDMSEETALQLVNFAKQYYRDYHRIQINWFGGEPLLNFNVIKLITDELIKAGFILTTHVTTNGSLLTQDIVDFFKHRYEHVSFQITVDDIGKAYYNVKKYIDLTEDNAFDTIINNTKLLLKSDIQTRIRINFLKENFSHAVEIFDYLSKLFEGLPAPDIYFAPLSFDHKEEYRKREKAESEEHTHLSLMKFYTKRNIVYDKANTYKNTLSNLSLKPKAIPCGACRPHNLTITAEGLIFKCHRIVTDNKCAIGNVYDGINEDSKYYRVFVDKEYEDPKCLECNVYPICRGGCKVEAIIYGKRENSCDIFSKHTELVELYYKQISDSKFTSNRNTLRKAVVRTANG